MSATALAQSEPSIRAIATGVVPQRSVDIATKQQERVTAVLTDRGDGVEAGALLIETDAAELLADQAAAVAELEAARVERDGRRSECLDEIVTHSKTALVPNARSPARCLWVMLLAQLFESLLLVCPNCGADMRIIAFVTEAAPVERVLSHIGEPPRPPPISPARDEAPEPASDWDLVAQPEPAFEFDQRITR